MKLIIAILGLLVSLPISFYISYSLLTAIHADRLLWFLFWINLPVVCLVQILSKIVELGSSK